MFQTEVFVWAISKHSCNFLERNAKPWPPLTNHPITTHIATIHWTELLSPPPKVPFCGWELCKIVIHVWLTFGYMTLVLIMPLLLNKVHSNLSFPENMTGNNFPNGKIIWHFETKLKSIWVTHKLWVNQLPVLFLQCQWLVGKLFHLNWMTC